MTNELDKLVDKLNAKRIVRRRSLRVVRTPPPLLTSDRFRELYFRQLNKVVDNDRY